MPAGILKKATSLGLNDSLLCFTFDQVGTGVPGTPLFRDDGKMVAMIAFSDNATSCAVPVKDVKTLIGSAGELKPFEAPVTLSDQGNTVEIPIDSPAHSLVVDLNLAGEKCLPFAFFPTSEPEYRNLQTFSKLLIDATEFESEHP